MTGIVYSLADLGKLWNTVSDTKVHPRKKVEKEEKPRKCRICGAIMERVPGSNVYVCHGTVEVPKPTEENFDAKETKDCTNFIICKL